MKSKREILDNISLVEFKQELNPIYNECDDDWFYYDPYDYDYDDSDYIKSEYLSKRNGTWRKIKIVVGRNVDLLSLYSKPQLRQIKLESLLEGKPLITKNYLQTLLDEESISRLYDILNKF